MELNLYIYSGLGNIIALVDLLREDLSLSPEEVMKIAGLEGVEFDQLISILPPESPDVDLSAEIYNADGSIAKNCINGARCLTKFVVDEELIIKNELLVTTLGGLWSLKTHQDGEYSVKFTNPNNLEIKNNLPPETTNHKHIISVEGNEIEIGVIDLGNPHAVSFEEMDDGISLKHLGEALQTSDWFPEGVNFGVGKIISSKNKNFRVNEILFFFPY